MPIRMAVAVRGLMFQMLDVQLLGCQLDRSDRLGDNSGFGGGGNFGALAIGSGRGLCVLSRFQRFRSSARNHGLPVGVDQRHRNLSHADRLAVARAGKDHVFHASAAQALGRLFTKHPSDGVAQVGLAAPVGSHDSRHPAARKTHFGAVAKRLKPLNFNTLENQQKRFPLDGMTMGLARPNRNSDWTALGGRVT